MIDTVLWDVDGTLMDFKRSEHDAIRKAFADDGIRLTDDDIRLYSGINDDCWKKYERGQISRDEAFTLRFRRLFEILGISTDVDALNDRYQTYLGEIFYLQDEALSVCRALSGVCRQYVVTNGHIRPQTAKLNASGLSDIMDGVFISGAVGYPKPEKAFFDHCFSVIGEDRRARSVIVGDSLTSDMLGGNNAGIMTCWYNPEKKINDGTARVDAEISNLNEIFRIIKKRIIKKEETL